MEARIEYTHTNKIYIHIYTDTLFCISSFTYYLFGYTSVMSVSTSVPH